MNGQDSRIADLYTVQDGGLVADDTPNAGVPDPTKFDLVLEAEAGDPLGNSGAAYTLNIYAVSDDGGAVPAGFNPGVLNENWNAANGWKKVGNDFVKTGAGEADGIFRFNISIAAGAIPAGTFRRFHYNADLISVNFEVTSLFESESFVLVGF
jgi:hypothetical protein